MENTDTCVTLCPYFKVHDGKMDEFTSGFESFMQLTGNESKCLFYGFSVNGDTVHCREGYSDADGVLHHLENVDAPLKSALAVSDLVRLEIHGPAAEVDKLRGPLAGLNPDFFVLQCGFRR